MNTQQQKRLKILLIGDDCLDVYKYGKVDRLSPEAPVPVFVPEYEIKTPGMAANVKRNLEAFGCEVNYLHGIMSLKTRLIESRSKQHIVRIDNDLISEPFDIDETFDYETFDFDYDAIVISDYNKGFVSYEMVEKLINSYSGPIIIDTKKTDLKRFEGAIIKINELEYSRLISEPTDLIVTLGDRGARWDNKIIPGSKVEVVDVCGAGDTFLATFTHRYLKTNSFVDAIVKANKASAYTVQHTTTYCLTETEINTL